MIGVGPGWEGTYGEPPLRPVNRRLTPTQVRILVLPPAPRPADTWSPTGPGRATRRARFRSDVAPPDASPTPPSQTASLGPTPRSPDAASGRMASHGLQFIRSAGTPLHSASWMRSFTTPGP